MTMNQKDYYQILEVEKEASPQKIKEAYRRLAFQYHPDRNKGKSRSSRKDEGDQRGLRRPLRPKKRKDYDTFHEQYGPYGYDRFKQTYSEQDIFRGSDIDQIFEEMSRAFGVRGFEEVFQGVVWPGIPHLRISKTGSFWQRVHIFRPGFRRNSRQKIPFPSQTLPGVAGKLVRHLLKKTLGMKEPSKGERPGGCHLP